MNKLELEEIMGIINFYSDSKDFFKEYTRMGSTYIYNIEGSEDDKKYGLVITTADIKLCVVAYINLRSFLNLKLYLDKHIKQIPSSQGLFTILSNIYGINIICSFVKEVNNNFYKTFIVTEKDGQFFCSNVFLSDAVCFNRSVDVPLYMNNRIIKEKGINPADVQEFIVS
jgi:bifunctional DNase/RNase